MPPTDPDPRPSPAPPPTESLPARTRGLLGRFGLHAVRSLGQNFLMDENIARKLVGAALELGPETVLEVGPGLGALTVPLAESGVQVIAFERDKKLERPLRELLAGVSNVQLIMGDFLEADLEYYLRGETVVLGNLPYYITSPILEKLFVCRPPLKGIVVTMQHEVARRLQGTPGTKEYGSLTVFCAYHVALIEEVCRISRKVFHPAPEVDSTALRMIPRSEPPAGVADPAAFFAGVHAAFGYRRKTLKRALSTAPQLALDAAQAEAVLAVADIAPDRRGDTLNFAEFVALGNALAGRPL